MAVTSSPGGNFCAGQTDAIDMQLVRVLLPTTWQRPISMLMEPARSTMNCYTMQLVHATAVQRSPGVKMHHLPTGAPKHAVAWVWRRRFDNDSALQTSDAAPPPPPVGGPTFNANYRSMVRHYRDLQLKLLYHSAHTR